MLGGMDILYTCHALLRDKLLSCSRRCGIRLLKAIYCDKWYIIWQTHYGDVIMSTVASQINSLMIVCSNVYSGTDQRKHQSSASLAFVWGIHHWPVNSPRKGPVTRKMFPFDDAIMSEYVVSFSTVVSLSNNIHRGALLLTWLNFNSSMDK